MAEDTGTSRPPMAPHELYRHHFRDPRRERLFLASVGFFVACAVVRSITYSSRAGIGPFHNLSVGQTHVHHLVWGILLLLLVGYVWLLDTDDGFSVRLRWVSRITALFYGVGSALTLDEFALWLNLSDVYWERQGRESIDAVLLFAGLLFIGIWGGPFFRALAREALRPFRR